MKTSSSKSPSISEQGIRKLTKNPVFPQLQQKLVARRAKPSILKQLKALVKSCPSPTVSSKRGSPSDPHAKVKRTRQNE
ncbi:hypothetical protein VNO77_14233 [Canavalia gladiata]|uniref:Uncharacterized protein n=1 Tax=Canavalia gladiata TaxID=3824 RepID=A0AAN9LY16_CANGL